MNGLILFKLSSSYGSVSAITQNKRNWPIGNFILPVSFYFCLQKHSILDVFETNQMLTDSVVLSCTRDTSTAFLYNFLVHANIFCSVCDQKEITLF